MACTPPSFHPFPCNTTSPRPSVPCFQLYPLPSSSSRVLLSNPPPFRSLDRAGRRSQVGCSQASSSAQRVSHRLPWGQAHDQLSFPTYFYALANIAVGSEISWGFPVRGHLLDLCSCHEVQEVVKVCSALLLWSHIRNASPSP
jgi:hypothetical protein